MPYRRSGPKTTKRRYPSYRKSGYKATYSKKRRAVKAKTYVKSKSTGWIQAERKKYRLLVAQKKAQQQAVRVNESIGKLQ